jgi:transcription initiation factor TFIIB
MEFIEGQPSGRGGAVISLMKPDMGLASTIGERRRAGKLGIWAARTMYTQRQWSLAKALRFIDTYVDKLGLDRTAAERAAYMYRKAVGRGLQRGRTARSLAAASVYASCREAGIPRTLNSVAEAANLGRKNLARDYRVLVKILELKMPIVGPERYVPKIAATLRIDERTKRQAYSILAAARRNGLVAGKDPKGLAASALYLASGPGTRGRSQADFARASGVTEVTLRSRAHQLRKYLQLREPGSRIE